MEEAAGIYAKAAAMVSLELHSPILCIGRGVPAIVCRWEEQSSKGFMWRDIGLVDWLFDFDRERDVARMPGAALAMVQDLPAARARAAEARRRVQAMLASSLLVLNDVLDGAVRE